MIDGSHAGVLGRIVFLERSGWTKGLDERFSSLRCQNAGCSNVFTQRNAWRLNFLEAFGLFLVK